MDDSSPKKDLERLAPDVDIDQAAESFNKTRNVVRRRRRVVQGTLGAVAATAALLGLSALIDDDAPPVTVVAVSEEKVSDEIPPEVPAEEAPAEEPSDEPARPLTGTATDVRDLLTSTLTDLEDRLPPASTGQLGPGWIQVEPAPIDARTNAVALWTGTEVLIWGGRTDEVLADGAAYNPATQTWRVLAPSPLSARSNAAAAWTGSEMVVLGGLDDARREVSGGGAYDPATDSWRELNGFAGATDFSSVAVWTGSEIIVVGVSSPSDLNPESNTAAYVPATNTFEPLPPSPHPRAATGRRAFVDGESMLVVQADEEARAMYVDRFDLERRIWVSGNHVPGIDPHNVGVQSVAWTGDELIFMRGIGDGVIYDPPTGAITAIPGSRSTTRWPAVMVDDHVFIGDIRFDPVVREWLTDVAYPFPDRESPMVVAIDSGAFVWGGDGCGRAADCSEFTGEDIGLIWTEPFDGADTMVPPLDCDGGEETLTLYDHADEIGFLSREDAVDDWWENGDGRFRSDRSEFEERWHSRFVTYVNAQGQARLTLRLDFRTSGLQVIVASSCST